MFSGSSTNNPPLRCHVCRSKGMFKGMEDFNFGKPIKGFEDIVLCADGSEDQSCPGKSLKEKQHKINKIVQGLGYRPVTFSESVVSYCVCVKITNMTSKRVIQRGLVPASKHPFCQTHNCNKRDFQPKWKGCWMKGNISLHLICQFVLNRIQTFLKRLRTWRPLLLVLSDRSLQRWIKWPWTSVSVICIKFQGTASFHILDTLGHVLFKL